MTFHVRRPGPTKHDKENARAQRRAAKAERLATRRATKVPGQGAPIAPAQFESAWPNAPEPIARTLSRMP